jgi:hypothetical protein
VLKNSVFEADEKIMVPQADLINLDMRGYGFHSKTRCDATDAAEHTKRIGFSR